MPLIYRLFAKHFTGVRVDREDEKTFQLTLLEYERFFFFFFFFKVKGLLLMIQAKDL